MQDELLLDWTELIHILLFLLRQNIHNLQFLSTCFVNYRSLTESRCKTATMDGRATGHALWSRPASHLPRERVAKAWTDADQFKQWFGAAACEGASFESVRVDARVGGKYRLQVRRADGEFYTTVGTYREVKPAERLVFTWAFEKDGSGDEYGEVEPPETLVTVEFKAHGEQTELTLTHEKFMSVESRDRHEQGWTRCLKELGQFAGK
jgi:uncharacterized protein YndB with AHSA1/START domain